jgi:2-C-methyl-D-erythritol 2,4-cyclodiphosphate synthase
MTGARSAVAYDSHRLVEGRRLVLGGVEIPETERGLIGHSDADVLSHAVMDAMLGAAALGDTGVHFPDDDPRWRDADSIELLGTVTEMVRDRGLRATYLDAMVLCEAPKLGPYRDEMRARLGAALGLDPSSVSVKFTTNEGMGFVGRGEGIAVLAVVTVAEA